jgi:hypothetical protein
MLSGVETAEFFLFFYNKQLAYYLPKRLLDSTGINEIRTMMQNKHPRSGAQLELRSAAV